MERAGFEILDSYDITEEQFADTLEVWDLFREAQYLYLRNQNGDREQARRVCDELMKDIWLPRLLRLKVLVLVMSLEYDKPSPKLFNLYAELETLYAVTLKYYPRGLLENADVIFDEVKEALEIFAEDIDEDHKEGEEEDEEDEEEEEKKRQMEEEETRLVEQEKEARGQGAAEVEEQLEGKYQGWRGPLIQPPKHGGKYPGFTTASELAKSGKLTPYKPWDAETERKEDEEAQRKIETGSSIEQDPGLPLHIHYTPYDAEVERVALEEEAIHRAEEDAIRKRDEEQKTTEHLQKRIRVRRQILLDTERRLKQKGWITLSETMVNTFNFGL